MPPLSACAGGSTATRPQRRAARHRPLRQLGTLERRDAAKKIGNLVEEKCMEVLQKSQSRGGAGGMHPEVQAILRLLDEMGNQ